YRGLPATHRRDDGVPPLAAVLAWWRVCRLRHGVGGSCGRPGRQHPAADRGYDAGYDGAWPPPAAVEPTATDCLRRIVWDAYSGFRLDGGGDRVGDNPDPRSCSIRIGSAPRHPSAVGSV